MIDMFVLVVGLLAKVANVYVAIFHALLIV